MSTPEGADPAARFIASMTLDYEKWHDGIGYDLDALRAVPGDERADLEALLIARVPRDWRDIEALGFLGTPAARDAVRAALTDPDPHVHRLAASVVGPADDAPREALLVDALESAGFGSLSATLEEAEAFHPPRVIEALLRGTLRRPGDVAVHFAALLYFLHGKSSEAFDWDHRPFFLRFNTTDRAEREAAFRELCETIGVESDGFL